ncbi:RHS repeat-associated core domain-containing protein, partial [Escherichia marmotae]|nr:RHS repeat-associated core domain-containing protein [Escherichia marmotae]
YFYDPTGHITACRSEDEGYLASWQYDAAGNLLGRRAGERATAENSVVPFNRLLSYRGVHYRYDEHGRVVEKQGRSGTQSYRYDAEHRMVEVTTARETYRYVYDALGRRTEKQHISPDGKPYNRTKFLWDGMRLAKESRPGGTSSLYIYSDQGSYEPLARVDKAGKEGPNRILYFHTDVNGAPEEMTDSDGKIVWETGYQVWGNTIQEKDHGRVEQNLRYQGQYLDRETGLHYNLHRYYDPDVGRFIVTDPIGLNGGINLYAYAPNPISWIDPLGLLCKSAYSGRRGVIKAKADLERNGFTVIAEEVTMKVNGKRIRADIVAQDANGNYHVFEVKNGRGRLTRGQKGSGVYNNGPANTNGGLGGGGISPSKGTQGQFEVSTNGPKGAPVGGNGNVVDATFWLLRY